VDQTLRRVTGLDKDGNIDEEVPPATVNANASEEGSAYTTETTEPLVVGHSCCSPTMVVHIYNARDGSDAR